MFEVIPVLDLKGKIAVAGKSGLRDTYKPLQTIYSHNSDPFEICNSLRLNNAKRIYIADLDLIEGTGHNINLIKHINLMIPVILDAGVKNYETFKFLLEYADKIIIATETLENIGELEKIFKDFPNERIIISVDIKNNQLYSKNLKLNLKEFCEILKKYNPSEIILLDISNVGTGKGFNEDLLEQFKDFKDKIIIGGGINPQNLKEVKQQGIKKALIGTSLHSGEIRI